jgi:tetratricopeptide (TPR) repeat protein
MKCLYSLAHRLLPVVILAFLLCAGCGVGQTAEEADIQADLGEASRAAQLRDTAEAKKWVDRAIAVDPGRMATYAEDPLGSESADITIADVFQPVGDAPSLIYYMQQALKRQPQSLGPLTTLAEAQRDLGDIAGMHATAATAVAVLTKKLGTPGTMPGIQLLNALGQAFWYEGDLPKAAETFNRVISTFPNDSEAYNNVAYMWAVENSKPDLAQALVDAKKSLQLAKDEVHDGKMPEEYIGNVQDTLGWVQYRLGDFKSALQNVQAGVNAEPRQPECHYHLASIYLAQHDVDDARIELTRAVLLDPSYADAQRELSSLPKASPSTVASASPPANT